MDSLAALRLQVEWGADEALDAEPRDHFRPAPPTPVAAPGPLPARPAAPARTGMAELADFDALHAALDAFDGCPLRATATTTVRPDGNPSAGLVLVAEAPGADDDRAGTAFAGVVGQTLDRILRSAGFDRTGLLLCHLVPWRPPGGRAPTEAEVQACLPFLLRLLQLARPTRLVLLGAAPVKALLGHQDGIRRLRGRWLAASMPGFADPVPTLPMLATDQWLRTPAAKRDLWADLLTLRAGPGASA